jgi:hypothetical protein
MRPAALRTSVPSRRLIDRRPSVVSHLASRHLFCFPGSPPCIPAAERRDHRTVHADLLPTPGAERYHRPEYPQRRNTSLRCRSCSLFQGGWNWLVVRWTTASTCDNLQVRKLTFAWLLICFSFSKLPPSLLAISPAHFFFSGVIHWRVRLGSILTLV